MRTCLTWLIAAFVLACGGKKDPAPATGSGSAEPPAAAGVQLYVDDKLVATVEPTQLAGWPRLDTLVPVAARRLGTWTTVYLKGGAKPAELSRPSSTYPDMVPAVFPGDGGTASFGMFDPVELAKHGKPALREDGVREIRIQLDQGAGRGEHESGEGGGSDPTKLKIAIKTKAGEQILTGTQLLAIDRVAMPGSEDAKGWRLTTLLEAGGVKTFERLVLTDAAGMSLTLERKDFDDKSTIPFVKLNKQGALRFRVLAKQGDGWQATGDLRALSTIEVVK
jgi:hypothetical protein